MTQTQHPRTALEAWVSHTAPEAADLPGYLELLQAAELAHTVKGQEGLAALEHIVRMDNGRVTVDHGPFDPEILAELQRLVTKSRNMIQETELEG